MALTDVQYRQGAVLLVAAGQLPAGVESIPLPADGAHALMPPIAGAGTGTHLLSPAPRLRAFRSVGSDGPAAWLEVSGGSVTVTHPEHAPLILEPGIWRILRQRQYDPASATTTTRAVAD